MVLPNAFVKRRRSISAESGDSSTSNKRSNSGSIASHTSPAGAHSVVAQGPAAGRLAAMDLNTPASNDGSSSSSTEPLMSENGGEGAAAAASSSTTTEGSHAVKPRHTPPADGRAQLDVVIPETRKDLAEGDAWFVVDRNWYRRWQAACGGSGTEGDDDSNSKELIGTTFEEIGPINNSKIANAATGKLIKQVVEGQDVVFLPGEAYHFLEAWYGTTGLPVKRQVIRARDGLVLDLFPPTLTVSRIVPSNSPLQPSSPKELQTSSGWTIKTLKGKMAQVLGLEPSPSSRIWILEMRIPTEGSGSLTPEQLTHSWLEPAEDDDIIRTSSLTDDTRVALEQASEDGSWIVPNPSIEGGSSSTMATTTAAPTNPLFGGTSYIDNLSKTQPKRATLTTTQHGESKEPTASSSSSSNLLAPNMRVTRSQTGSSSGRKGLAGLQNLGNTCFMNSALQCLSNTPALQDYFHSGMWQNELNPTNLLGMKGEVAKAYGQLMDRIWNGSNSVVTPREFKYTLSKFAPAFSGWQQHDSQELIAFLLDGLHEDLNRIKKKPYDEIPDWNGGGDKEQVELANLSWELYKRRNDSVIVDLFQGQLRNRLTCPECGKIAIKFDPFMYLSLAIPQHRTWTGDVYVVPLDPKRPQQKVTLEVPAGSTFKKLKQAVGALTGQDPAKLFTLEEYSHKFFKVWSDTSNVGQLSSSDLIVMYELPYEIEQPAYRIPNRKTPAEEGKIFCTLLSSKDAQDSKPVYGSHRRGFFGEPLILALTAEEACNVQIIERKIGERFSAWQAVGNKLWSSPPPATGKASSSKTRAIVPDDEDEEAAAPSKDVEMDGTGAATTENGATVSASLLDLQLLRITVSKRPLGSSMSDSSFTESGQFDFYSLRDRFAEVSASASSSKQTSRIPGSFTQDDPDDLYGDGDADKEKAEPSEEAPSDPNVAPRPILRTGETIIVDWDAQFVEEAFSDEAGKSRQVASEAFSKQERVIDPAVTERRKGGKEGKKAISINNLLDEFIREEKLSEDNMWYCSSCKKHQEAPKKFDLWRMPDVLVVHLKRFSNERAFRDKIDTFIDFPINGLDLTDKVEGKKVVSRLAAEGGAPEILEEAGSGDSLVYDLYAVDNHFGGLGGGHYTAYAKNIQDEKWYNFDDSRVSPVADPENVKTSSAYLLFYRRRTNKPIGGKTHEILASQTGTPSLSAAGSRSGSPTLERQALSRAAEENAYNANQNGDLGRQFKLSQPGRMRLAPSYGLSDGDEVDDENKADCSSNGGDSSIIDFVPVDIGNLDVGDIGHDDEFDAALNSMAPPSPALSNEDINLDADNNGLPRYRPYNPSAIHDWQSESRLAPSSGWDFGKSGSGPQSDQDEGYAQAPDVQMGQSQGQASPKAVEIRLDEAEMAQAASGIEMDGTSHMDEVE